MALVGNNGVGKTNILEALSLFTPGRGLRRADLADMARLNGTGSLPFAVSLTLDTDVQLGIGLDRTADGRYAKIYRVQGLPVASATVFAEHLRLIWLTPDFDALFRGSAGERRRFLDRLVLAIDSSHGTRVSALERALRSRNRLLEDSLPNLNWLQAVEKEVAELGVAVAAARFETVQRLQGFVHEGRNDDLPFPWSDIRMQGEIDDLVAVWPALDAEDRYRTLLYENRNRDRTAGRTLIGPQTSDLVVQHGPKAILAAQASTGEQKALLIGIVLAHARLVRAMSGLQPFLLLDEIAAHLDQNRRQALFQTLVQLGAQVFMTGTDKTAFMCEAAKVDVIKI